MIYSSYKTAYSFRAPSCTYIYSSHGAWFVFCNHQNICRTLNGHKDPQQVTSLFVWLILAFPTCCSASATLGPQTKVADTQCQPPEIRPYGGIVNYHDPWIRPYSGLVWEEGGSGIGGVTLELQDQIMISTKHTFSILKDSITTLIFSLTSHFPTYFFLGFSQWDLKNLKWQWFGSQDSHISCTVHLVQSRGQLMTMNWDRFLR